MSSANAEVLHIDPEYWVREIVAQHAAIDGHMYSKGVLYHRARPDDIERLWSTKHEGITFGARASDLAASLYNLSQLLDRRRAPRWFHGAADFSREDMARLSEARNIVDRVFDPDGGSLDLSLAEVLIVIDGAGALREALERKTKGRATGMRLSRKFARRNPSGGGKPQKRRELAAARKTASAFTVASATCGPRSKAATKALGRVQRQAGPALRQALWEEYWKAYKASGPNARRTLEAWRAFETAGGTTRYKPPRKRNPSGPGDLRAGLAYVATHWGLRGKGKAVELAAADPTHGTYTALGRLKSVVYETEKGGDGGVCEYEHEFDGPHPVLAFSPATKKLVIAGGRYTVSPRGIVH